MWTTQRGLTTLPRLSGTIPDNLLCGEAAPMTKCSWPHCSAESPRPFEDGWSSYSNEEAPLPGMPRRCAKELRRRWIDSSRGAAASVAPRKVSCGPTPALAVRLQLSLSVQGCQPPHVVLPRVATRQNTVLAPAGVARARRRKLAAN
jgi:hypothetical protein